MRHGRSSSANLLPMGFLTAAAFVTVGAFAWMGWNACEDHRINVSTLKRGLPIAKLRSVILHLDEVLTMSARMAAATGDPRWESRYRDHEPKLEAAIEQAVGLAPEQYTREAVMRTDAANVRLVEMENRAFDLVQSHARPRSASSAISLVPLRNPTRDRPLGIGPGDWPWSGR